MPFLSVLLFLCFYLNVSWKLLNYYTDKLHLPWVMLQGHLCFWILEHHHAFNKWTPRKKLIAKKSISLFISILKGQKEPVDLHALTKGCPNQRNLTWTSTGVESMNKTSSVQFKLGPVWLAHIQAYKVNTLVSKLILHTSRLPLPPQTRRMKEMKGEISELENYQMQMLERVMSKRKSQ